MKKCYEYPDKKRYNVRQDAERVILLLDNRDLRAYLCQTCRGWHLTSSKVKK